MYIHTCESSKHFLVMTYIYSVFFTPICSITKDKFKGNKLKCCYCDRLTSRLT